MGRQNKQNKKVFKEKAKVLKAVANDRRLEILCLLKKGEKSVGEVASVLRLSFRSTSKHLQRLSVAGLIEKEQRSSMVFYELSKPMSIDAEDIIRRL